MRYQFTAKDAARFWAKVDKASSPSGCWLWIAGTSGGYGRFNIGGRVEGAHRVAWALRVGPLPDGMDVLHNCPGGDNPRCVNPAHLFLGTQSDNDRDMWAKGRARPGRTPGEAHHRARLTEADVRAIRSSSDRQCDLVRRYGVSQATIWQIIKRQTWKHVP